MKSIITIFVLLILAAVAMSGCASKSTAPLRLAVPVPCAVQIPPRPQMPTEALRADVSLDDFVAAAAAEIERREGYEVQLRAAIDGCNR